MVQKEEEEEVVKHHDQGGRSDAREDDDEEKQRLAEWKRKRQERQKRLQLQENKDKNDPDTSALHMMDGASGGYNNDGNGRNRNGQHRAERINNHNEEEEQGEEIMTAAKRRRLEQEAILGDNGSAPGESTSDQRRITAQRRKQAFEALNSSSMQKNVSQGGGGNNNDGDENEIANNQSNNERNNEEQQSGVQGRFAPAAAVVGGEFSGAVSGLQERSDGNAAADYDLAADPEARLRRQQENEEARILREASKIQTNALQAAKEVAKGLIYTDPMPSSWTAPSYIVQQGPDAWQKVRDEWHMQVQGNDIPPPLKRFIDMKLPKPVIELLKEKGIQRPTPIQMQGLPVALAGRDMVGIAFTGSGKTLTFSVPLVMAALEAELTLPLLPGEGPVGMILAPSRELARQTHELVDELCQKLSKTPHYPQLRSQLMIGGESARDQLKIAQTQGLHCLVATPGRLRDVLKRKAIQLYACRYICLDEADRLIDMGFDEEVGEIMNYFPHQRQTLLFSATFPQKFQDFCRQVLVQPIVVNVGRAGAANLDVIQEVEYVKEEAKIVYLLHCLQKTAPPVIIFCERKGAADDIHEYLLLKGVEAVSIHGGKDQEERNMAIALFKSGQKDVLIATDVAAKGLDFPDIQHVINFDMPTEIENYVHRIGRTGRCGKTGVATTFINKSCAETTLLDLKALLKEAKQRIPPVLDMLEDPRENHTGGGCSFCGGLGHSIVDCPKIDKDARRVAGSKRDVISGGGDW